MRAVLLGLVIVAMAIALATTEAASISAQQQVPDKDCAFDPNGLAKCKSDVNGKCPSGFSANDKGNCFPKGPCPTGYARKDNDEISVCSATM